jgi:ribonuclease-3
MALSLQRLQELKELEACLNVQFRSRELLNIALTHSSYSQEKHCGDPDNERLEFLGDAVLKLVISEYLFNRYPDQDEGYLTKLRATLISDATLATIANQCKLGRYLLLSKNEQQNGGTTKKSIVANAMEALFGACYLDGGLEQARKIIIGFMTPLLASTTTDSLQDYKSVLQERIQALGWKLPEYRVIQERGPEHNKVFTIQVKAGKGLRYFREEGCGRTKKEAEQQAAKKALAELRSQATG